MPDPGTHRLALLQHGQHEEDVAVAGLQASVVKAAVLLLVARLEGGRQHGEARRDVGPRRLELAGMPQAAPLQPGDVLGELRGTGGRASLRAGRGVAHWGGARRGVGRGATWWAWPSGAGRHVVGAAGHDVCVRRGTAWWA